MKTKTLSKSRRGISPILATLLLIVIAVAAIVVTYAWIMIYLHGAGQQAGVMIKIENVYFKGDGNKSVIITIRNTGTSDTNLVSVYMGESAYNLQRIWEGSKPLPAKTYVTIEKEFNWTSNKTYYFKAIAEGGQETALEPYQAP